MLHIGHEKVPVCSGINRRSFLQAGAVGRAGLSLPDLMQMEASGAVNPSKTRIGPGNRPIRLIEADPTTELF